MKPHVLSCSCKTKQLCTPKKPLASRKRAPECPQNQLVLVIQPVWTVWIKVQIKIDTCTPNTAHRDYKLWYVLFILSEVFFIEDYFHTSARATHNILQVISYKRFSLFSALRDILMQHNCRRARYYYNWNADRRTWMVISAKITKN